MRHRIPKTFTILITCTGKTPITLSVPPLLLFGIILASISFPVVSVARLFQSMTYQNTELTRENRSLDRKAREILEDVQTLEKEINALQRRAGMTNDTAKDQRQLQSQLSLPQGGVPPHFDARLFLQSAQAQLPQLAQSLKGEIEPALERTLDRENARPSGVPLKATTRTTSEFGRRRNPFGGGSELHSGLDFVAAYGSPIHTTAPGTVMKAELSRGYGYMVVVNHDYGFQTLYAHMSGLAVSPGDRIDRYHVVGYLGNTGRSTGPHLHYEVHRNSQPVDPDDYLD